MHSSWKEVKAKRLRAALSERVLSFSICEFYNKCHDENGHFCAGEATGGIPKHEQPVLADAPEHIKDEVHGLLSKRRQAEPEITGFMKYIARANDGEPIGLDFKFKEAKGIIKKIERKVAEKGIDAKTAAMGIGDALRYTVAFKPENYVAGVKAAVQDMKDKGYKFQDFEDNWQRGDAYNGINATFKHPNGLTVELQFHTPESFHVKDRVIHKDYEFYRERKGNAVEMKAAFDRMVKASDGIKFPPGIDKLCAELGELCKSVHRPHKG